jgi:hypothetical protein
MLVVVVEVFFVPNWFVKVTLTCALPFEVPFGMLRLIFRPPVTALILVEAIFVPPFRILTATVTCSLAETVTVQTLCPELFLTVLAPRRLAWTTAWVKVAVTEAAAVTTIEQGPVPEHDPAQPVKRKPGLAFGVRVTVVPLTTLALQAEGQVMPDGELVTVPLPDTDTESGKVCVAVKIAPIVWFVPAGRVHVVFFPAGAQAPVQPPKVDPLDGVSVRVTVPAPGKEAEHVAPQLIPAGLLVTVPWPVPDFVTVKSAAAPKRGVRTIGESVPTMN